jgi:pre-rRNA-processing protein TSR4
VSAEALLAALPPPPPPPPRGGKPSPKPKKQRRQREPGKFQSFYVETFDEPDAEIDPAVRYEIAPPADSGSDDDEEPPVKVDPILVEYNERISRCPDQIVRYARGGEPLLQEAVEFTVPPCPSCGEPRIFEFELIPTIIYLLDSEMDFGPILVYTCGADCGSGSCEEFCFVTPPM